MGIPPSKGTQPRFSEAECLYGCMQVDCEHLADTRKNALVPSALSLLCTSFSRSSYFSHRDTSKLPGSVCALVVVRIALSSALYCIFALYRSWIPSAHFCKKRQASGTHSTIRKKRMHHLPGWSCIVLIIQSTPIRSKSCQLSGEGAAGGRIRTIFVQLFDRQAQGTSCFHV